MSKIRSVLFAAALPAGALAGETGTSTSVQVAPGEPVSIVVSAVAPQSPSPDRPHLLPKDSGNISLENISAPERQRIRLKIERARTENNCFLDKDRGVTFTPETTTASSACLTPVQAAEFALEAATVRKQEADAAALERKQTQEAAAAAKSQAIGDRIGREIAAAAKSAGVPVDAFLASTAGTEAARAVADVLRVEAGRDASRAANEQTAGFVMGGLLLLFGIGAWTVTFRRFCLSELPSKEKAERGLVMSLVLALWVVLCALVTF